VVNGLPAESAPIPQTIASSPRGDETIPEPIVSYYGNYLESSLGPYWIGLAFFGTDANCPGIVRSTTDAR
jgi:hypothetical protein